MALIIDVNCDQSINLESKMDEKLLQISCFAPGLSNGHVFAFGRGEGDGGLFS